MSGRCAICAKQPSVGRRVARTGSNSLKRRVKARTSRTFRPNLQTVRVAGDRRTRVCTRCLKAGKVERRVLK